MFRSQPDVTYLALAFAGGVRIGAMASCPSPVLPDGMNQPGQRVNVDVIEPADREAHHVLLFAPARMAARTHGKPRTRFVSSPLPVMVPLRGSRRCRGFLVKLCGGGTTPHKRDAWRGSAGEVAVSAA